MGLMDLEEHVTFYAAYHHDGINKWIHIFSVWSILWAELVLLQYVPYEAPDNLLPALAAYHPFTIPLLMASFYAIVYFLMDKRAGTLGALLVVITLIIARKFYLTCEATYGVPAWKPATGVVGLSAAGQFVGHFVFEGRAPALIDSLLQTYVLAPLLVLLDVLFLFGYRKDFQKRVSHKVMKEVAKLKAEKNKLTGGMSN